MVLFQGFFYFHFRFFSLEAHKMSAVSAPKTVCVLFLRGKCSLILLPHSVG